MWTLVILSALGAAGAAGELPAGLPDFSRVGYREGAVPPEREATIDPTEHGARPGDGTDDGPALQAALDAAELGGPYRIADNMAFDEIIDPRDLRNALLRGLGLSRGRRAEAPAPIPRFGALP